MGKDWQQKFSECFGTKLSIGVTNEEYEEAYHYLDGDGTPNRTQVFEKAVVRGWISLIINAVPPNSSDADISHALLLFIRHDSHDGVRTMLNKIIPHIVRN